MTNILHSPFMQAALDAAKQAYDAGEVPIGAVMVDGNNAIIATTHNQTEAGKNPILHAEMLVIQQACEALNQKYLMECTLYVTLEPCAMCAQAIAHAKVGKVIFAAEDPKGGAVLHGPKLYQQPTCHWHPEVISGINASEAEALLKQFFQKRR